MLSHKRHYRHCLLYTSDAADDKAIIDKWWEQNNVVTVSPATDEEGSSHPYFSHFPAFGLGSDVIDCNVMMMK